MKGFFWTLYKIFPEVGDMRAAMRADGSSEADIATATEQMVRHHLEPLAAPMNEWPEYMLLPKCGYCDGTGLVIHRNVLDKHGVKVDSGHPCRCTKGAKFLPPTNQGADFKAAGKTPTSDFTRAGRR